MYKLTTIGSYLFAYWLIRSISHLVTTHFWTLQADYNEKMSASIHQMLDNAIFAMVFWLILSFMPGDKE